MNSGGQNSRYSRLVNAEPISEFLCAEQPSGALWSPSDLTGIWKHQLATNLCNEFRSIDPAWALLAQQLCTAADPQITTFESLLHHRKPPSKLLELTKTYAKANLTGKAEALPEPIATGIYFLTILLARVRCTTNISSLLPEDVSRSCRTLRNRHWMDTSTQQLLDELLRQLDRTSA